MKKIFVSFILFVIGCCVFAQDYKIPSIKVPEPEDAEILFDAGDIKLMTTHELHNKEYDMYAEVIHIKTSDQVFRFNQKPGASRIMEIKNIKYFKYDDRRSVFFCTLVDTVAGIPVSPVFFYQRPVLIIVTDEVYLLDTKMLLGGDEDDIGYETTVHDVANKWELALVIEIRKRSSKEIMTKVLNVTQHDLVWEKRLAGGWKTENTVTDPLNMRDQPGTYGKKIGLIPKGASVMTIGATRESDFIDDMRDRWFFVTYQGKSGWIFGGYVQH